jgi:hypothetical protein
MILPARARCRRSPAASDRKSEQNHGYENEWEEAHNEQEDCSKKDHPPGKRRTGGSQEDQRQEEGPGAEDCCPQDSGPQGACEADGGKEAGRETRRGKEASSETRRGKEAGSEARSRAKEKSSSEKASRSEKAGSGTNPGRSGPQTRSVGPEARARDSTDAFSRLGHAAAACRSHGRRWHATTTCRRHRNAWALHGRRHAGRKFNAERAALPAVLGARRRRSLVERGGTVQSLPSLAS